MQIVQFASLLVLLQNSTPIPDRLSVELLRRRPASHGSIFPREFKIDSTFLALLSLVCFLLQHLLCHKRCFSLKSYVPSLP